MIISIIVGIVFVADCIGGQKATDTKASTDIPANQKYDAQRANDTKTSTVTQTNQKTYIQTLDLILKLSDVPDGFELKNYFYVVINKSQVCPKNCSSTESSYDSIPPIGYRNRGGFTKYSDKNGRYIIAYYLIFDSDPGFKIENDRFLKDPIFVAMETGLSRKCTKSGQANIGDNSVYSVWCEALNEYRPELIYSQVGFSIKNTLVQIEVLDEKKNGHDLALEIAKIVQSRLN